MFHSFFLLFLFLPHAPQSHEFRLPPQAVITVESVYHDKDKTYAEYPPDTEACEHFHVTPSSVRWRFGTHHRLTGREVHENYRFGQCGIEGKVKVGDRVFTWKLGLYNTMETTYPDGKPKLLGGTYSDEPSEGG
jgi:hypothetical protein